MRIVTVTEEGEARGVTKVGEARWVVREARGVVRGRGIAEEGEEEQKGGKGNRGTCRRGERGSKTGKEVIEVQ